MSSANPFAVRRGLVVRHYRTNHLYTVLHLATLEGSGEDAVVYQSSENGRVWVRTLANFTELVPNPASGLSTPVRRFFPEV